MIRLKNQVFIFLLISIVVPSCKGQLININSDSVRHAPISNNSKLIKTQGTNEFQILGCSLKDKSGNLWFGTTGEGVYKYDGKEFKQFTKKDGLGSNDIHNIIEDSSGYIWLGSKDAIIRFDGKSFTNIPIPGINQLLLNKNSIEKNELWSMMQDRNGIIWLGTTDGIFCFDGKTFTRFLDNKNIRNDSNVQLKWTQCIYEDKAGNIWFGSWVLANEGLCRYDGRSITQFKPYGEGWIRSVMEDKNGELLIVTRHSGVCRFDGEKFINFTQKGGILNDSVNSAYQDKAGNLWFGTELGSGELKEDGGLWRYDGKTFFRYTTMHGLVHNGVFSLLEDNTGNLWIGTRNIGLCSYNGQSFTKFSE